MFFEIASASASAAAAGRKLASRIVTTINRITILFLAVRQAAIRGPSPVPWSHTMNTSGILLVTGAGRGIGAAIARLAARRGYTVCVNYLQARDRADEVVLEIERGGGAAFAVEADISAEAGVLRLFEAIDRQGPLRALVNNAATLERQMRLVDM